MQGIAQSILQFYAVVMLKIHCFLTTLRWIFIRVHVQSLKFVLFLLFLLRLNEVHSRLERTINCTSPPSSDHISGKHDYYSASQKNFSLGYIFLPFLSEHLYTSTLRQGLPYHWTGLIRKKRAVTEGSIVLGLTSNGWERPLNTWNKVICNIRKERTI